MQICYISKLIAFFISDTEISYKFIKQLKNKHKNTKQNKKI